ncbi:MAG: hypothetical protein KAT37_04325 [Candidatus Aenigmarchaeota archaeon]|nr:hypothetical protein [Candidatus Aenigmarchaeota archaeon]
MVYEDLGIKFKREIPSYSYEEVLKWTPEKLGELRKKKQKEITILFPTLNRDTAEYYNSVDSSVDAACELLDMGFSEGGVEKKEENSPISQVMFIDGSSKNGKPDLDFGRRIINRALNKSERLKAEVELIDPELPESRKRYMSLKILNQKGRTISKIVREDISPRLEKVYRKAVDGFDVGKGPGCWIGIPSSFGDLIGTIDTDIRPPKESKMTIKDYAVALAMPALKDNLNYVKFDYLRINEVGGKLKPGGRINRNVYQTWMSIFQNFGFFMGLNLGHATSGECLGVREKLNDTEVGPGYRLEVSLNMGSYLANEGDVSKMGQVHVGPWKHIPSGEDAMGKMAGQVTEALIGYAYSTGLRLTTSQLMKVYEFEFEQNLKRFKEKIDNIPLAQKLGVTYEEVDMEEDRHRVYDIYWPHIERGVETALRAKGMPNVLPKWNSVKIEVGNERYVKLKADMAQASTLYTLELANL